MLTIYLPLNILSNYLDYYVYSDDELFKSLKLYVYLDAIISPICIGSIVYVLNSFKTRGNATYQKAMAVGLRNWFHLFATRFIVGILVFLGFIAFIIPGLILLVRYSLIDSVVILENLGQSKARSRSKQLTEGNRWAIFRECAVLLVAMIAFSMLISLPYAFIEPLDNIYYSVFTDCIIDITFSLFTILLFLFYWEAKERETNGVTQPLDAVDSAPSPQS